MENKSVRKIDIFNILKFVFQKWLIVAIVAVLFAGAFGGYGYFQYKVQQKNEEFVKANSVDLVYGAFVIMVNNYDESDHYYNRMEDVTALVKGYSTLGKLMEENNLNVNYATMSNCIAIVTVGINQMEVSVEGSLIGLNQEQVVELSNSLYTILSENLEEFLGEGSITLIEAPHAKAYALEKALSADGEVVKITKKDVVKKGIIGGIIGVVMGAVLVVFYMLLSTVLRTKNEVVECYGMSILGSVDKDGKDKEECKRIVKRIADNKVMLFASATNYEFRNEAVYMIASNIAVNGKKTVVVRINEATGETDKNPLYKYISGKNDSIDTVEKTDNALLKVMNWTEDTSAEIDLFTNDRFAEAVEKLKNAYDYVLIDCPAMIDSAAVLNVATVCDASVIVGSCGKIKEETVNKIKYNFAENDIKPLGLLYIG